MWRSLLSGLLAVYAAPCQITMDVGGFKQLDKLVRFALDHFVVQGCQINTGASSPRMLNSSLLPIVPRNMLPVCTLSAFTKPHRLGQRG